MAIKTKRITVRRLIGEDAQQAVALLNGTDSPKTWTERELYLYGFCRLNGTQKLILVCTSPSGELVGILLGRITRRYGVIDSLVIHPDFRREGYGSALMRAFVRDTQDLGYRKAKFLAWVHERDVSTQLFFRNHLFRANPAKKRKDEYGEDVYPFRLIK